MKAAKVTEALEAMERGHADLHAKFLELKASKGEAGVGHIQDGKGELDKSKTSVHGTYDGVAAALQAIRVDLQQAMNIEQIVILKDNAIEQGKTLTSAATVKEWGKHCKEFKTALDQAGKAAVAIDADEDADMPSFNFIVAMQAISSKKAIASGLGTSFYEAKAGIKGCLLDKTDAANTLLNNAIFKSAAKQIAKHHKTADSGNIIIAEKNKLKRIEKVLRVSIDPALLARYGIRKEASWATKILGFSFFGRTPRYWHVGFPPHGAMVCRLQLSGSSILAGIPVDKIPGGDLKAKRRGLINVQEQELVALLADGFFATLKSGDLLITPTGFIVLECTESTSVGLWWTVSSDDADARRCLHQLQQMIEAYPEVRQASTGFVQFKDFLAGSLEDARA